MNIYALVYDSLQEQIESKELHEKVSQMMKIKDLLPTHKLQVIFLSGKLSIYSEETGHQSALSGCMFSRQVSTVQ